jgi:hypothetical protein
MAEGQSACGASQRAAAAFSGDEMIGAKSQDYGSFFRNAKRKYNRK